MIVPLSRPHLPFWGPLVAILDVTVGGVFKALQAVRECPCIIYNVRLLK